MITCVIIDDEPLARQGLADLIGEVDFLELTGTCESPVQLIRLLEKQPVDLLFLDIQMPLMTGLEFLRTAKSPPMTIITTAFADFALEGFKLSVVDYLLKPITFDRFFAAVSKAQDFHRFLSRNNKIYSDHFFIKCGNRFEKILVDDILYLESMQNYVIVHTLKGKFMTLVTMKSLEQYLDPLSFIRVHKSFMVAIRKIEGVDSYEIQLPSATIPISRSYKDQVLQLVVNKNLIENPPRRNDLH